MGDPLGTAATRLLATLRETGADSPDTAAPDHLLARLSHLPHREIIDAARELLNAGVLVLAGPCGRWLGTLAEALHYREQLLRRVKNTAGRVSALDRAIAAHQRQLSLQFTAETPRAQGSQRRPQ